MFLFSRTFRAFGQEGTLLVILDICYKEVACYLERLPFILYIVLIDYFIGVACYWGGVGRGGLAG